LSEKAAGKGDAAAYARAERADRSSTLAPELGSGELIASLGILKVLEPLRHERADLRGQRFRLEKPVDTDGGGVGFSFSATSFQSGIFHPFCFFRFT
jgi:hypothetical protein